MDGVIFGTDLASGGQGIRAHHSRISFGRADRIVLRNSRALFLAVAIGPARPAARCLPVNIAMFSLLMPVVALSPTFATFRDCAIDGRLRTQRRYGRSDRCWSPKTWPARLRGRVNQRVRARAGVSARRWRAGLRDSAADFGWRVAVMVPGVIALLAIYVRATCPESPYWVARAGSQAAHLGDIVARGGSVSDEDRAWFGKAKNGRHPPGVLARRAAGHAGGAVRGVLQHLHFRHVGGWMPLISPPKNTGRPPNTACSMCSGASRDSSASASRAGSPTRSAGGWRSS